LLDRIEFVFSVGRHGVERDVHAADGAPVGEIDVRRAVAVDIFRAQRQTVFGIDPQRLGLAAVDIDFYVPGSAVADRAETVKCTRSGVFKKAPESTNSAVSARRRSTPVSSCTFPLLLRTNIRSPKRSVVSERGPRLSSSRSRSFAANYEIRR